MKQPFDVLVYCPPAHLVLGAFFFWAVPGLVKLLYSFRPVSRRVAYLLGIPLVVLIAYLVPFRDGQLIGVNDPNCLPPSLNRRTMREGSWQSSDGSSYVISPQSYRHTCRLFMHPIFRGFHSGQATLKGQYTSRNESMGSEKK